MGSEMCIRDRVINWWYQGHYVGHGVDFESHLTFIPADVLQRKTLWREKSKPIWITALGCPAVDKGSNEPDAVPHRGNAGVRPRYSNGQRDDYIQRQYLPAFISYWPGEGGGGNRSLSRQGSESANHNWGQSPIYSRLASPPNRR